MCKLREIIERTCASKNGYRTFDLLITGNSEEEEKEEKSLYFYLNCKLFVNMI